MDTDGAAFAVEIARIERQGLRQAQPATLVNIFRIFKADRSVAAWSVSKGEADAFKTALLAEPDNTRLSGDLLHFAPNLFWFDLLEDISNDEPFLWLHCGEQAPRELKKIITDNNLEPYIEHRGGG